MHQGTGTLDERPTARFAANRDRKLELEARRENTDVAGNHAHAAGNEGSNVAGEGKDRTMSLGRPNIYNRCKNTFLSEAHCIPTDSFDQN